MRIEELNQLFDKGEVSSLESFGVFLPEVFAVARSPSELVGINLLLILLEAGQNPVVSFEHIFQSFKVLSEFWVFDILSLLIFDDL